MAVTASRSRGPNRSKPPHLSGFHRVCVLLIAKSPLLTILLVVGVYRALWEAPRGGAERGFGGRQPLSFQVIDETCITAFDSHGGAVLYVLGILLTLVAIAVICEEDFKNSIIMLAKGLNMPPDIAGATLMAAGTSSPELFASLVALGAPSDDVGSGTVVGSVVFNTLVIIGGSVIFAGGRSFLLDRAVLFRDAFWNIVSVAYLLGSFWDARITWYEAMVANLLYCLYVVHMANQSRFHAFLGTLWQRVHNHGAINPDDPDLFPSAATLEAREDAGDLGPEDAEDYADAADGFSSPSSPSGIPAVEQSADHAYQDVHDPVHPFETRPHGVKEWVEAGLFFPWKMLFWYTVPNPASKRLKHMYALSFPICLLWLAVLTWMIIGWATKLGCILGIPDAIMGATVLAVGTSMADCLTSIAVAREGQGNMAVSNAFGSNIFDILVALGLPWLLETVISGGRDVSVQSSTIGIDSALCIICVLVVLLSLRITNWRLTKVLGYIYFGIYILFLLYLIGFPLLFPE